MLRVQTKTRKGFLCVTWQYNARLRISISQGSSVITKSIIAAVKFCCSGVTSSNIQYKSARKMIVAAIAIELLVKFKIKTAELVSTLFFTGKLCNPSVNKFISL